MPFRLAVWVILISFGGLELPGGHIAYLQGRDVDTYRVHVLDLKSREEKKIDVGSHHGKPVWSTLGDKIAFSAKINGKLAIVIYDLQAEQIKVLNHRYPWNDNPTWSKEDQYVAYVACERGLLDQKVAVYDLIADREEFWGGAKIPSIVDVKWFHNLGIINTMATAGTQITFTEGFNKDHFFQEVMGAGVLLGVGIVEFEKRISTELILFTKSEFTILPKEVMPESLRFEESAPDIAPKGVGLVFETNEGGDREIYYLGRRGVTNISNHHSADWNPFWSPNGEWVVFESFRNGRRGIYRVYPDTARVFPVEVSTEYDNWSPCWSPDGEWICFVSNRTGIPQIYVKSIHSDEVVQITDKDACVAPMWRPKKK